MIRHKHYGPASRSWNPGFTLIELLIVVAIIAILAAIAVPNFLEAQVRAKVSRAKADMRTIAIALDSYAIDQNRYPPNDGVYNVVPIELTTPVAFLSNSRLVDPFSDKLTHPVYGELARYYTYTKIVTYEEFIKILTAGPFRHPPVEAVDSTSFNPSALKKYGPWRLVSNGPDCSYALPNFVMGSDPKDPNNVLKGADIGYDPSNGTASAGNILRTQISPEGNKAG